MILHVCALEKFIPPFVKFVNEEFGSEDHQFWMSGGHKLDQYTVEESDNVFIEGRTAGAAQLYAYVKLLVMLHKSNKVMLHGLFDYRIVVLLAMCPWLLKKCYWMIWGADLYQHQWPRPRLRNKIREWLKAFVIQRIGHLVTYIPGDVELAREWYGARGKHRECLMYLSNVVNPEHVKIEKQSEVMRSIVKIQIGNSADPSNNHLDALKKLLPYKSQDIEIYVPLSYGDQEYAQKVMELGNDWFGEKFIPITTFMTFDQYIDFLKNIDIAIFSHQRQQAMGNTITLLALGKTVYMRSDVSQWDFLQHLGLKLRDVSCFEKSQLSVAEALHNKEKTLSFFSRKALINQYAEIFNK